MELNADLKKLWTQQYVEPRNIEQLHQEIKRFKREEILKIGLLNLIFLTTSIFIIFIWYVYQPKYISTKTGVILTILAMLIYIISYNQQFFLFRKMDNTLSNTEYLKQLSTFKARQTYLQTKGIGLYFILLSLGIGLYMYEYVSKMTILLGVLWCSFVLIGILINWFFLRPRIIKKQNHKTSKLISDIELLREQIDEV